MKPLQSLYSLVSRHACYSRLCRSRVTRARLLFSADFRAKERLLAVYCRLVLEKGLFVSRSCPSGSCSRLCNLRFVEFLTDSRFRCEALLNEKTTDRERCVDSVLFLHLLILFNSNSQTER